MKVLTAKWRGKRIPLGRIWKEMYVAFLLAGLFLLIFWLWAIAPQMWNRPDMTELKKYDYAHRGLHNNEKGIPENSLPAFRLAAESGFGIELDLQLTKDDQVVVHHDRNIKRLCGEDVEIRSLTLAELQNYHLLETEETIPTFQEALMAIGRRTPVIVEIKGYTNASKICPLVWEILQEYEGLYCVESFNPLAVKWFRKNQPKVIRGQLMNKLKKGQEGLSGTAAFFGRNLFTNFLARPHFEAYCFSERRNASLFVAKRLFGMQECSWTITSWEDYHAVKQMDSLCIFEGFEPFAEPQRIAKPLVELAKEGTGAAAPCNAAAK